MQIFAVNTVLPMLGLVYWGGNIPRHSNTLISLSVLVGTFFGQLLLGVAGDRLGRRSVYGYELLILTMATVLMSIASKGALQSTSRTAWICAWRFIMGIGIGGDYPLSATIVAEFAPRKHRGTMLSALFYMQAFGVLIANSVTVIAVIIVKENIPTESSVCDAECIRVVDNTWRWIIGIGAIPPAIATFIRWWIPESPRYTLEVEKDPNRAAQDIKNYFPAPEPLLQSPISRRDYREGTLIGSNASDSPRAFHSDSEPPALTFGEQHEMKDINLSEPALPLPQPVKSTVRKETWKEFRVGYWKYLFEDGNWVDLAGTSISWLLLDFAYYFLSVNNPKILNKLWSTEDARFSVYQTLLQNGYRALIANSTGGILGGALFIAMARYRWQLQYYGFWMLAGSFIIVGVCFVTLLGTRFFAAIIVLYASANFFFNFGPNTSTYTVSILHITLQITY